MLTKVLLTIVVLSCMLCGSTVSMGGTCMFLVVVWIV